MELESLFTASKWEILQCLAEAPYSPLELAQRSSTSLANVSQQLRLLEMAGLVTSERIPNRDKGQPRIKYRLAGEQSYLIAASNDFVDKKLLKLTAYNKAILRIWFYDDPTTRYVLEKAFWQVEPKLAKLRRLSVLDVGARSVRLCAVTDELAAGDFPALELTTPEGAAVTVRFEVRRGGCHDGHLIYTNDAVRGAARSTPTP